MANFYTFHRSSTRRGRGSRSTRAPARMDTTRLRLEVQAGQNGGAFLLDGIKTGRVEPQGRQNRRCYLGSLDEACQDPGVEAWVRDQQHDVGIILRKAAVLSLFFGAARVNYPDIRLHDDVGTARVTMRRQPWRVEHRF